MPKKVLAISSVIFLVAMILLGVLLWREKRNSSNTDRVDQLQETKSTENTAQDSLSSIKDLIDGEYQFPPVNTSKWKTYRNDELGFEVKIPEYLEEVDIERDPKAGFVQVGFGKKGELYSAGEGTFKTYLFSIRSQDQSNADILPLREYVESRIRRSHDRVLAFSIGGINAIFLGTDEVFAYKDGKEWEFNLPMVSMERNLHGVNSRVKGDEEMASGILQTFQFTR